MLVKGKYCIVNGEVKPASSFHDDFIVNGQSIYEVIRIFNRKPVFFDQHLDRMYHSANITKINFPLEADIKSGILQLVNLSNQRNGNIEIVVNNEKAWSARFIPHHYPAENDYANGVKTMFYEATRQNPNAKVKLLDLRSSVNKFIAQNNIYEVIYVNQAKILEGSRSNIFFVDGDIFFTPPVQSVLPGITRQVIIELVKLAGYKVQEKEIQTCNVQNFNAAFLTGTSPGVLPINSINKIHFNVRNEQMRHMIESYKDEMCK